jgi:hypothetical protein
MQLTSTRRPTQTSTNEILREKLVKRDVKTTVAMVDRRNRLTDERMTERQRQQTAASTHLCKPAKQIA